MLFTPIVRSYCFHDFSIAVRLLEALKKMNMRRNFSEMNFTLVSNCNRHFHLPLIPSYKHEEIHVS